MEQNIKVAKELIKLAKQLIAYQIKLNNKQKQDLIKYIEMTRNNEDVDQLSEFFYNLLTKGGLQNQEVFNTFNSYTKEQKTQYNKYIEKLFPLNNGDWSQINFNYDKSHKNEGKTYNFYVSIEFPDKKAIIEFMKSLYPLMQMTKKLSDKHNKYIGFKTHPNLTPLLTNNDTIKFYYYDNDNQLKKDIEHLVNEYVSKFNLKRGTRLYEHGLDSEDINKKKRSFGQKVSEELSNVFIKWIKDNKDKYTNQQFIKSFERDLDNWIKSIADKLGSVSNKG